MLSQTRCVLWPGMLALALVSLPPACANGAAGRRLSIYWVDVEGGAATLMVTPAGESILVDTGVPGERDPSRIARVAKETAGLRQIDHLVVTHFDVDHHGGAPDGASYTVRIPATGHQRSFTTK